MRSKRNEPNESPEPILLATNGTEESVGAVRAASELAAATDRPLTAIAVVEPPPIVAGEYGFVIPIADYEEGRRDALVHQVRKQLDEILGRESQAELAIRSGAPPATIANVARETNAALIVMGLGHHQLVDRIFGSETALHTLRAAHTPLFAVPQTYAAPPRQAIVGIDFSGAGLAAVQSAVALLPSLTRLTLVHVAPRWDLQPTTYVEWRLEYDRGVGPAFERVVRELDAPHELKVDTVVREGRTTQELLTLADERRADVIIVGSKGLGFLDRVLVGSTATGVIRGAHCAVFAFPVVSVGTRTYRRLATSSARERA